MSDFDAREVNDRLRLNLLAFCEQYLSAGRLRGHQWKVGSVENTPGTSLVIEVSGGKQGAWADFDPSADVPNKTPLDLWMAVHKVPFKQALEDCAKWLGMSGRTVPRPGSWSGRKKNPPPEKAPFAGRVDWKPLEVGGAQWAYLTKERGLPEDLLRFVSERGSVGQKDSHFFPQLGRPAPAVVYVAWDASGKRFGGVKYRSLEKDEKGNKVTCSAKGSENHLIGMNVSGDGGELLDICEGEEDWLSCLALGKNAVSVMFGAAVDGNRNEWLHNDHEWLNGWREVRVNYDGDDAGRAAQAAVGRRLGLERVLFTEMPDGEDCNSLYREDPAELERVLTAARALDPEVLARAGAFREDVWREFFPENEGEEGYAYPWNMPFRCRLGEITNWTGYSKHGKTVALSHCIAHWASQGARTLICSFEMKNRKTLRNLWRQATGLKKPIGMGVREHSRDERQVFDEGLDWLDERVWLYDRVGVVKFDDVLEVMRYAARRYGVDQFVIDSLMRMDVREDDYDRQKEVMNRLAEFVTEYDVHVHIVCHAKKSDMKRPEERHPPRKHDVNGSAHLTNIPHNTVAVWRNLRKEAELYQLEAPGSGADVDDIAKVERYHDATFLVLAQREGEGDLPIKQLWYDKQASWQFWDKPEFTARRYVWEK